MGSEWGEITLEDALEFVVDNRGKTVPVSEHGIALIATNCISNDNLYPEYKNVRYVSEEIFNTWFRSHPQPNDILLTNKGSKNGAVCLVPDPLDFCIAQDMVALRADCSKIDPSYLFAALRSPCIQSQIKQLNVDSVIPHFKKTDFDKLFIPLPTEKEQKVIGMLYLEFSKKIELNRRMNATLEGLAQALFQSWFVDFDPVLDNALAAGNPIPDELTDRATVRRQALDNGTANREAAQHFPATFQLTEELGWIPEGWEALMLSDLLEVKYGKDHKKLDDGTIPVYGSGGLMRHANKSLYMGESVLIPRKGTLSNILYLNEEFWTVDTMFYSIPKRNHVAKYIFHLLKMLDFTSMNVGSAVPSMTTKVLNALPVLLPDESTLQEFDSILTSYFSKQEANKSQSMTLTKLRDTLLPQLISGELRIPDAAKLAEAALA